MSTEAFTGIFYDGNSFSQVQDGIAAEVALQIVINGSPFTVTMQTPGNEFELVRGLLFTENIYRDPHREPRLIPRIINAQGHINVMEVQVPAHLLLRDFTQSRQGPSVSSCGLCGKTSLEAGPGEPVTTTHKLDPALLPRMLAQVTEGQRDFPLSGGTHAAAAFTSEGQLLALREDIGRHNAVDKVIGALIASASLHLAGSLLVTGRLSYELVEKARSVSIPFLAGISAPTTLAIKHAQRSGVTLMAFCRGDRFTIYSNPERVNAPIDPITVQNILDPHGSAAQ